MTQGLAPSTRRVYSSAQRRFLDFCIQDNRVRPNGSILPASQETLMRFCSHLADNLHHTSIKVYLSGIRSLHIDEGYPDPLADCLQLQRLLRGIKRCQGSNLVKRRPITGKLMQVIYNSLDMSEYNQVMLWAACCLGFFGFLRAGEFTVNSPFDPKFHLIPQDLQVDSLVDPKSIKGYVKCSKTDPFRQGCFIYIGKNSSSMCPVKAIIRYLHLRGPGAGPLFTHRDGSPLTRRAVSASIQSILQTAGIPGHFSGHSFRIGAATTAAEKGVPNHMIKMLGRWSSDAYQRYIRTPVHAILQVSERLT